MNRNASSNPGTNTSTNTSAHLSVRPGQSVRVLYPWSEFEQMRRQMDDLVGGLMGFTNPSRLLATQSPTGTVAEFDFSPDIYETATELVFVAPVPGLDPNDLNIEATESSLVIRGERKPFYQQEGATQHRQSWWSTRMGTFQASYTLPFEINPEGIQAHYRNGILELHLPKVEATKPRKVKVNVLGDASMNAVTGTPAETVATVETVENREARA